MDPIRVLLVDDNAIFLRVAARFLEQHQELALVGIARSGREALDQAQDLRPQVILIDLDMPGLSGLETIPRLRVMLPEVGIIALTFLDTDRYRQAALATGADDFVSKAKLSTDLLPAIRRVAQTSPPGQEPSDRPGASG